MADARVSMSKAEPAVKEEMWVGGIEENMMRVARSVLGFCSTLAFFWEVQALPSSLWLNLCKRHYWKGTTTNTNDGDRKPISITATWCSSPLSLNKESHPLGSVLSCHLHSVWKYAGKTFRFKLFTDFKFVCHTVNTERASQIMLTFQKAAITVHDSFVKKLQCTFGTASQGLWEEISRSYWSIFLSLFQKTFPRLASCTTEHAQE